MDIKKHAKADSFLETQKHNDQNRIRAVLDSRMSQIVTVVTLHFMLPREPCLSVFTLLCSPSHIDSSLSQVTCFGQCDINKCDIVED